MMSFDEAIQKIAERTSVRTGAKVLTLSDEENEAKIRKALFLIFLEDGIMIKQLEGNAEAIVKNWTVVADELTNIIFGRRIKKATTFGELCLN